MSEYLSCPDSLLFTGVPSMLFRHGRVREESTLLRKKASSATGLPSKHSSCNALRSIEH
jgi:hypothetical protein